MSVHDFHLPIVVAGCVAAYTVIGSFVGTAAYCCDKEYPHQKPDPYVIVGAFWPFTIVIIALFYLGYLPHLAASGIKFGALEFRAEKEVPIDNPRCACGQVAAEMIQIQARIHGTGREHRAVIKIRGRDFAPLLLPIIINCDGIATEGRSVAFDEQMPRTGFGEVAVNRSQPRAVIWRA